MRWTLIATACALTTTWSLPKAGAAQNEPSVDPRLLQGHIISSNHAQPGTKVRRARAEVLIDAKMEDVLSLVENYGNYKGFLPNFQKSEVLSQRGASALVYLQISILHGASSVWAQVKLKPKKGDSATRVIEGKMMKGNVTQLEARWEVTRYSANQTLVAFELLVDPDLPVPSTLVTSEVQKTARKVVRALRKELAPKTARKG